MKKKSTPRKRKPSKNIMLMTSRYKLVIKAARSSGYKVCIGPKSQIGAFITDAALFYAKSRTKLQKGAKLHARNNGHRNDSVVYHPKRTRIVPTHKDHPRTKEKKVTT